MAHPKSKKSKAKKNKRRTHYKASEPTLGIDKTTGQPHLLHRAHWHEDKMYYKGKVVIDKSGD